MAGPNAAWITAVIALMPGGLGAAAGVGGFLTLRFRMALGLRMRMACELVGVLSREGSSLILIRLLAGGAVLPRGVMVGVAVCFSGGVSTVRSIFVPMGMASLVLGVEPEAVRFLPAVDGNGSIRSRASFLGEQ